MKHVLVVVGVLTLAATAFPQEVIHRTAPYSRREVSDPYRQPVLLHQTMLLIIRKRPVLFVDEGQCPDGWEEFPFQPSVSDPGFAGIAWCTEASDASAGVMGNTHFDLLSRMAKSLNLILSEPDPDEDLALVHPAVKGNGLAEPIYRGKGHQIYIWLLGYEAAVKLATEQN